MPESSRNALTEIAVSVILAAIATAFFINSLGLPVSTREPLGSGSIPRVICGCIILFCLLISIRALRTLKADGTIAVPKKQTAPAHRKRTDLSFKLIALSFLYIGILQTRLVPNEIVSPLFLFVAIQVLNGFNRKALIPSVLLALTVGLVTDYLFTDFFYIDLP